VLAIISSVAFACNAAALLAQVAAATGGSSWKTVGEIAASGRLTSSGLRGTAELRDDLRGGRYAISSTLPIQGTSVEVYDGQTVWARDISGGLHPYDSWYPRARAITDAYLTRRAYFNPRAGSGIGCVGFTRNAAGRTELVRVEPLGGIPAVLAIDSRTHLIDSVSIRTPISADVTTYGDYRQAGRLVLPFSISSASAFEPENGDRIEVTRYVVTWHVNAQDFQKPRAFLRAQMLGGANSTTVPIAFERYQLLVWASINGRAPMPFILDTGGHAIVDTVAARILGLHAAGSGVSGGAGAGTIRLQFTRVASVRIGNAELIDQPFLVIPYPYSFYERGRRVPLAGILGLEWFERYAARIDYAGRTLTLTPLATFSHRGRSSGLPIRFQEDMPLARASADGNPGSFGVDTGNGGMLVLYGDFLRRTGLLAKYSPGTVVHGEGTGGSNTGRIETLSKFTIGGHVLSHLFADFTQMKTGSFSSWTEAGDLGLTALSRFTPTFDYANQMLYLDTVSHPFVVAHNRSGIGFSKNEPDTIDVVQIKRDSAASAAGIVGGDKIIAANGRAARDLSSADFLDLVTARAGTVLQLTIHHGTTTRTVQFILR
jgi:hypothetical protein